MAALSPCPHVVFLCVWRESKREIFVVVSFYKDTIRIGEEPHAFFPHRYAENTTVMAESKEALKSLLMKVKEESEKSALKLTGLITSWQIDGGKMKTGGFFFLLGSKITAIVTAAMKLKDTCSLEEKL